MVLVQDAPAVEPAKIQCIKSMKESSSSSMSEDVQSTVGCPSDSSSITKATETPKGSLSDGEVCQTAGFINSQNSVPGKKYPNNVRFVVQPVREDVASKPNCTDESGNQNTVQSFNFLEVNSPTEDFSRTYSNYLNL